MVDNKGILEIELQNELYKEFNWLFKDNRNYAKLCNAIDKVCNRHFLRVKALETSNNILERALVFAVDDIKKYGPYDDTHEDMDYRFNYYIDLGTNDVRAEEEYLKNKLEHLEVENVEDKRCSKF